MSKTSGKQDSDLTFNELMKARFYFMKHTEESLTSTFGLRTVLSEMGLYPPEYELHYCIESLGGKISFNNFCNYLQYQKKKFLKPEVRDVDTLRAYVALGGTEDTRGQIDADNIRQTVRQFALTIDIDAMIRMADKDGSGHVGFSEFKTMWNDTLPSGSQAAENEDEDDPTPLPAEEKIEADAALLKTFLFPNARGAQPQPAAKPKKRRWVAVIKERLLPIIQVSNLSLLLASSAQKDAKDGNESDSDASDDKGLHTVNCYRPPSPMVLSLRHLNPAQMKHLKESITPRKPGSPRGRSPRGGKGNTPRGAVAGASPRAQKK